MKINEPSNVFVILACDLTADELVMKPLPGKVFDRYVDATDALVEMLDMEESSDCLGDTVYTIRECGLTYC